MRTKRLKNKTESARALSEARKWLMVRRMNGGKKELKMDKGVTFDKSTKQFSLRIPKDLALKAKLDSNSKFLVVFNPSEKETTDRAFKSDLLIFLKEKNHGEEKGKGVT